MASKVKIDFEARHEFDEAFDWYAKRSVGAAIAFAAENDAAIEKFCLDPDRFPKTYAGCQRCPIRRYPYSVVYYQLGDEIIVVAFAHSKRKPSYWRQRL